MVRFAVCSGLSWYSEFASCIAHPRAKLGTFVTAQEHPEPLRGKKPVSLYTNTSIPRHLAANRGHQFQPALHRQPAELPRACLTWPSPPRACNLLPAGGELLPAVCPLPPTDAALGKTQTPLLVLPGRDRISSIAKLSSIIINRDLHPSTPHDKTTATAMNPRRRRASSIVYHEPPENEERLSDQAALPNFNANWVHSKGA
jgi:hypothetical protein